MDFKFKMEREMKGFKIGQISPSLFCPSMDFKFKMEREMKGFKIGCIFYW